MSKVVIKVSDYDFPNVEIERKLTERINAEFDSAQCKTEEELIDFLKDADVILSQYAKITSNVIKHLKKCKGIIRYGIGVDNIDVEAATKAGIKVCNVTTYGIDEVADHTIALLFAAIRKICFISNKVKANIWDFKLTKPIERIKNKKLGLVGFGNIPQMVAKKLSPWDLDIVTYDPYIRDEIAKNFNVKKVSFDELLSTSDYVSVHAPLTKETFHLFNESTFNKMKDGAIFVNTARGGLVDEKALYNALVSKKLSFAAIDVMENEPPIKNHQLFDLDNIIITPHMAFYSEQALYNLQKLAAEEAVRIAKGEKPLSCVNLKDLQNNAGGKNEK